MEWNLRPCLGKGTVDFKYRIGIGTLERDNKSLKTKPFDQIAVFISGLEGSLPI